MNSDHLSNSLGHPCLTPEYLQLLHPPVPNRIQTNRLEFSSRQRTIDHPPIENTGTSSAPLIHQLDLRLELDSSVRFPGLDCKANPVWLAKRMVLMIAPMKYSATPIPILPLAFALIASLCVQAAEDASTASQEPLTNPSSQSQEAHPYKDTTLPLEARIDDLIGRMTLDEKASIMGNSTPGVPRLGIPKFDWWSEALHGVANAGHATVFPQAIGLAAMWDEVFHHKMASVIGIEGRAKFNGYKGTPLEGAIFRGLTFWSPNVNIFRDPRWGRGQETYGEDPFLTSRLGVAFVKGLQGDHADYLLAAACAKHYAVHSGPEPLRHNFDVWPDPVDFYETYMPAFEALVREANVEVVMTAYNALGGIPCSIHPLLYRHLDLWGFDGHVTSDCGSIFDLRYSYKWADDDAGADALVFRAGMNVRCGSGAESVAEAVRSNLISEAELDQRLFPLLRTMFRLGFFDPEAAVPFNAISPEENDTPENGKLALEAARKSLVLLKNEGLLPLSTDTIKRVAVIGPNASSVPVLVGNYNGEPSAPVTVLDGLKTALEPAGVKVDYAHGCDYTTRPDFWRPIPHPWFHGDYFDNPELAGDPVANRTERPICFSCNASRPGRMLPAGVPEIDFSVRWNGHLQTTMKGSYRFRVRGNGGFRLILDGKTIIDSWQAPKDAGDTERSIEAACDLPDNAALPITLEYVQTSGPLQLALEWITPPVDGQDEALAVAANADAIIFVGGISAQLEGEEMQVDYHGFKGGDRDSIDLPALQVDLLKKLHATGKPIVFINMSGSAVAMPWVAENTDAILQAWYPGQAGGTAIADVITGAYNPAGRLPLTFYRSTDDLPDFNDYDMDRRTYRFFKGSPLFAFGHGLSYTKFDYSGLSVSTGEDGTVEARVDITNSGSKDGDEVVQIYAIPPASWTNREVHTLCGFKRIHLRKGETRPVAIQIPATALRRWNTVESRYEIPSGEWTFQAAASSADIRQSAKLTIGKDEADGMIKN